MTWTSPRRDLVLRDVLAEVDRRLDGRLPMDVDGVDRTFRDEQTLVDVLQVRWQAELAAQVERALAERTPADDALDGEAAVVRAWRRTLRTLPGVRMVLDRDWEIADAPRRAALERRRARQHLWLAQQAVLVSSDHPLDDEARALGAAIEEAGRRYYRPGQRPPQPPLLKRLKAALAA